MTDLRDRILAAMREGGHLTYEEVADDVLHVARDYAADELRHASARLTRAPQWVGDWLHRRASKVQVTR